MTNPLFDISEKIALITGGAQGLGLMIASAFVRAGAKVYITSRQQETLDAAVAYLRADGGNCIGICSEISKPGAAQALAQELAQHEQNLDVLINNAGKTWGAPLATFPDKAWPDIMAVNVQGPFTLVRDLLPLLKARATTDSPSRVINIGSIAGMTAERISAFSYAASKAALHHLSAILAAELAADGITVNTVVPGYFATKMTAHIRADEAAHDELKARIPLQRLGEEDDIAGACLYLSSRAGRYVTGARLVVDGGATAAG